jgi:uncharacterized protein YbaA (DUF1428 family)
MIKILSIKNCTPVNIHCVDDNGNERVIFSLIDYFSKTLEVPNEEDLSFIKDFQEFQESVFAYYNSLSGQQVVVPEAVYDAYRKAQSQRLKAKEAANKNGY